MNPYEEARERLEQAVSSLRAAPGIPLPEYREQVQA